MATSTKLKEIVQQAEELALKNRKVTKTEAKTAVKVEEKVDEKFADIDTNTFFKIIFSEADPEAKVKEVAKALTFEKEEDKEKNQTRLKEFDLFKEWLQEERKKMASAIIQLTDTGAFSELQSVINDINNGVIEFDSSMQPLTEILEAVYNLRTKGGADLVLGVFKEIGQDKAQEARIAQELKDRETVLRTQQEGIDAANRDIASLSQQRKWFGLGGIKQTALEEIARRKVDIEDATRRVGETAAEVEKLKAQSPGSETQFTEFAGDKAKLRELLDLTSEQHKERQKRLVSSASSFVMTTDARVKNVLEHFGQMETQIDRLGDANTGMQTIYAVLTEGVKDAAKGNKGVRTSLTEPVGEESTITKMDRENKKRSVEEYIASMDASAIDTAKTYGDLATQGARINQMKDANREQVAQTRTLQSSGVAGVADRLSMTLQAVSAAALNESTQMAQGSIAQMNDKNNAIALKESIRTAMGLSEVATQMEKAVDDLVAYRDAAQVTRKIRLENLEHIKEAHQRVQEMAKEVQDAVKEAVGTNADVEMLISNDNPATPRTAAAAEDKSAEVRTAKPASPSDALAKIGKMGR